MLVSYSIGWIYRVREASTSSWQWVYSKSKLFLSLLQVKWRFIFDNATISFKYIYIKRLCLLRSPIYPILQKKKLGILVSVSWFNHQPYQLPKTALEFNMSSYHLQKDIISPKEHRRQVSDLNSPLRFSHCETQALPENKSLFSKVGGMSHPMEIPLSNYKNYLDDSLSPAAAGQTGSLLQLC